MRPLRPLFLVALLSTAVLAVGQTTSKQLGASNDTGIQPYGIYSGAHENINLANGNLSIQIPLVSLPGRAGHGFTLTLQYDSKNWVIHDLGYSDRPGEQTASLLGKCAWLADAGRRTGRNTGIAFSLNAVDHDLRLQRSGAPDPCGSERRGQQLRELADKNRCLQHARPASHVEQPRNRNY